jgi:hypothetical protein
MELQRGLGAKSTFENYGAFGPGRSLYSDTYRNRGGTEGVGRIPKATIDNDSIRFVQNTSNRWQRTNFNMGDDERRFSTTAHDAFQPGRADIQDPQVAHEKRLALGRSCVMQGNNWREVPTTEMNDAIRPIPGWHRPPEAPRTAFISHQDHRNWRGPVSTENRDSYYPKIAEHVDPVNNQLQESHGSFGNPAIHETRTLYSDTFKRPPLAGELADMDAARAFHMGHHSNNKSGLNEGPPQTQYDAAFIDHKGVRPSDMCDALKGGHNIVANDPRHVVKQSAMKSDYPHHPGIHRPEPIDNLLQRSHLQLKGCGQAWTTTQQDYFQYETYRMPGRPF